MEKKKRINPSFLANDWEVIKNYSEAKNRSMSDVIREFALTGMNRELLQEKYIESFKNLVHAEVEAVSEKVEELKKIEIKTCEAAATSMYLLEYFCSNIKMADEEEVKKVIQDAEKFGIEYVLGEEGKEDA